MENLKTIFSSFKTKTDVDIRPKTILNYCQKINRLSILVTGKKYEGDNTFLLSADKLFDALENSDLKSKKDYITPVIRLLRHLGMSEDKLSMYQTKMRNFKDEQDAVRKTNVASTKDIDMSIPLDDIVTKINDYKAISPDDIRNKAICSIYFLGGEGSVVLRNNLQDFKLVSVTKKIKDINSDFNYFIMKGELAIGIIMNRYKSQATYGRQKFDLTHIQSNIISKYFKVYNKKTGDFAFTIERDIPFTSNQMSELVKSACFEVIGKPYNIDMIRSIIATDYWKTGLHSIQEDEKQAIRFLHSVKQNREYVKPEFIA